MATPQDWYLKPQDGKLSKIHCSHCDREIGETITANQTTTGRDTGRSQEDVTMDAQKASREHLTHCDARKPVDSSALDVDASRRPPEDAPLKTRK